MQATRREILDYIRRHGQGSVKDLGQLLGLTSTGIRQHLTILERDGLIEAREERGRVGRPALVYTLTDLGDASYPKRYDFLAIMLLEELKEMAGSQGLQNLLRRVAARCAKPHLPRMEGKSLSDRVGEMARILQEEGCLVETAVQDSGYLIYRYTCPFANVAKTHSGLCALDVEFIRHLIKDDVRLVSCIVRGDHHCTYRIRPAAK